MTTERESMLRTWLKYGTIVITITSALLVGNYIAPDIWVAVVKVVFGGVSPL